MRIKPSIGVLSTIWKRHDLAHLVFENLANIREQLKDSILLHIAVAGSEGEASRAIAEKYGFDYIETPNSPLGAKHNQALSLFKNIDIDGVAIISSDDLVNEAYFRMLAESVLNGEKLIGINHFYVLDRFTNRLALWQGYPAPRDKECIGLGRFIHRDYIELLDWKLWKNSLNSGLDYSMYQKIQEVAQLHNISSEFSYKPISEYGICPVDIKHVQQITPFETTVLVAYKVSFILSSKEFLQQFYPSHILDKVFINSKSSAVKERVKHITLPVLDKNTKSEGSNFKNSVFFSLPFEYRNNITYIPNIHKIPPVYCVPLVKKSVFSIIFRKIKHFTISLFHTNKSYAQACNFFISIFSNTNISFFIYHPKKTIRYFPEHKIYGATMCNTVIWKAIFKIYIFETSKCNVPIFMSLIQNRNFIIVNKDMNKYIKNIKDYPIAIVDNMEEAFILAKEVHANKELYYSVINGKPIPKIL